MKKTLTMVLAMVMALSLVCMSVSAATVTVDNVAFTENGNDLDITVTYTAPSSAAELTMLAATSNAVTDENIADVAVAIDQFENATGVTTKTFKMAKPASGTTIYVRMGGTDAASANLGQVTYGSAPSPTGHTVTYYITAGQVYTTENVNNGSAPAGVTEPTWDGHVFLGWSVNGTDVIDLSTLSITAAKDLYAVWQEYTVTENTGIGTRTLGGVSNVSILRFTGLTSTQVVTVGTGTNTAVAKYYKTPAPDNKVVHFAVINTQNIDKTKVAVATGTPEEAKIGNFNLDASNRVNGTDVTLLSKTVAAGYSDKSDLVKLFLADVNGDGRVNGTDVTVLSKACAAGTQSSMAGYSVK